MVGPVNGRDPWPTEGCDECELGVGRPSNTPRATSNLATSIHTTTPTPAKPSTPSPRNTSAPPDRTEIRARWRRIAMCAICWGCLSARWHPRRRTRSRRRAGRRKESVRLVQGLRGLCGGNQWIGAAANVRGQRAWRVKSRRCMASDHHRSRFTKSPRRTARRGRALGLRRNGTANSIICILWV